MGAELLCAMPPALLVSRRGPHLREQVLLVLALGWARQTGGFTDALRLLLLAMAMVPSATASELGRCWTHPRMKPFTHSIR